MPEVEFDELHADLIMPIEVGVSGKEGKIVFAIKTNEETVKVVYAPKKGEIVTIIKKLLKKTTPQHFIESQTKAGWTVELMGKYYYFQRTDPKFDIFGEGLASGVAEYGPP